MNFKILRRKLGNWISGDNYTYVNYIIPIQRYIEPENIEVLRVDAQVSKEELFCARGNWDMEDLIKDQLRHQLADELVNKTKYTAHDFHNHVEYRMEVKIFK